MDKKLIGRITHFFPNISVAVVALDAAVKVGDKLSFEGPSTNFEQTVTSMQVEHKKIEEAKKGHEIGMKTAQAVREKDLVYKLAMEAAPVAAKASAKKPAAKKAPAKKPAAKTQSKKTAKK